MIPTATEPAFSGAELQIPILSNVGTGKVIKMRGYISIMSDIVLCCHTNELFIVKFVGPFEPIGSASLTTSGQ